MGAVAHGDGRSAPGARSHASPRARAGPSTGPRSMPCWPSGAPSAPASRSSRPLRRHAWPAIRWERPPTSSPLPSSRPGSSSRTRQGCPVSGSRADPTGSKRARERIASLGSARRFPRPAPRNPWPACGSSTSAGCSPVPICTKFLAALGAEVIKIESTGSAGSVPARHLLGGAQPEQAEHHPEPQRRAARASSPAS